MDVSEPKLACCFGSLTNSSDSYCSSPDRLQNQPHSSKHLGRETKQNKHRTEWNHTESRFLFYSSENQFRSLKAMFTMHAPLIHIHFSAAFSALLQLSKLLMIIHCNTRHFLLWLSTQIFLPSEVQCYSCPLFQTVTEPIISRHISVLQPNLRSWHFLFSTPVLPSWKIYSLKHGRMHFLSAALMIKCNFLECTGNKGNSDTYQHKVNTSMRHISTLWSQTTALPSYQRWTSQSRHTSPKARERIQGKCHSVKLQLATQACKCSMAHYWWTTK